jgi:FAD/FMN-containing dehydrogenase/Fe-S oxidoreductase
MPQLPVLDARSANGATNGHARNLQRLLRGQVRFDDHVRKLYSTDASIYQQTPLGVVSPADEVDVQNLLRYCNEHKIALLPRGGGTSLAGQCVNEAIVCDLSQLCRRVRSFSPDKREIHVESGMNIDEINRWLAKEQGGLFFAPDPATVAQCAIGGAIGNNAAGARSIRYGRTSENLAGVDLVLADGEKIWLGPGAGRNNARALSLARSLAEIAKRYAEEIRARFPRLNRRNAGYGIDLILHQLDAGVAIEDLDLSGLICGSEGTLGVVTSALLKLHPLPRKKGLAIVSFPTLEDAIDAVVPILATGAIAVELMDEEVLTAAAGNNECRKYLDLIEFVNGELPRAVLYVEYQNETDADTIAEGFGKLKPVLAGRAIRFYTDAPSMLRAWTLRKSGEPLLHGLSATRKPLTFVEDNSIPVVNLSRFVREFKQIVANHGTRAAYWAHASVGVLHVRPMIDLHDPADRENMISIAQQVADLARDCGGVMSGEHGDGRARGPLLERFFGPKIMACFGEIKQVFDPAGILNPGMIVGAGSIRSIAEHLRVDAGHVQPVNTYFDYSDQESFEGAVEMCNGAGFCRKTAGGTMCPSYRGTMDERHSTRGRGNALRLAISGQLRRDGSGAPDFTDKGTMETLDLCLACKACKSECPSNVDIARLKAEYMAQRWKVQGTPLYAKVFGHVRTLNKLGAMAPGIANFVNNLPAVRKVMNRLLGLAPQRSLPPFAKSLYASAKRNRDGAGDGRPRVVLYGDCFVAYNEPGIGLAAIKLLESLGYDVVLPKVGCCGRAMISTGLLADAARSADQTLAQLKPFIEDDRVVGVVVAEPSCLASFKDDWLLLKMNTPLLLREKLAAKSFLIEEFVDRFWDQHPKKPSRQQLDGPPVILHGHCHQKALWGDITSAAALRRVVGDRLQVLPSGCCGMAGSFGYAAHRYELSMRIGELSVFPPIRASAEAIVVAPGTSCRHQIHDGTGRTARHPVELLAELLT